MDLSSHILVVDDDPELRTLIGDFLRDHGYRVEVAADVAAMREAQWEIASHGLRWINYAEMPEQEERRQTG